MNRLEREKTKTPFYQALLALFMRIAQDAKIVQDLIVRGYDAQARNLLRSLDEHSDTIYYLCLRPDASQDFVATRDEITANKFWFEHIRRARRTIDKAFLEMTKRPDVADLSTFRKAERDMLSSAHHPSYAACIVPMLVPYKDQNVTKYVHGMPSEYSFRTGKLLIYILAEVAVFAAAMNTDVGHMLGPKRRHPLEIFARKMRSHLALMLLHLTVNWDAPVFSFGKEMANFLKTDEPAGERAV